jgi:hypothetical protein
MSCVCFSMPNNFLTELMLLQVLVNVSKQYIDFLGMLHIAYECDSSTQSSLQM